MRGISTAVLTVGVLMSAPALGATLAASVSGPVEGSDGDTNGWRFQVLDNLIVRELGVWDEFADGLPADVDVGLCDDGGALLGMGVVTSGTIAREEGRFRFTTVSPISLASGTFYRVGVKPQSGGLPWLAVDATQTFAPGIAYDNGYYSGGSSLVFPTSAST